MGYWFGDLSFAARSPAIDVSVPLNELPTIIQTGNMINEAKAPTAPEFTATDSEGRTVRLSDYAGKKAVVLVFNRGLF